jgi:hypothetical protein
MVSLSKSPLKKKKKKLSKEHICPFELDSILKIENLFAKFRIENLSVNTNFSCLNIPQTIDSKIGNRIHKRTKIDNE